MVETAPGCVAKNFFYQLVLGHKDSNIVGPCPEKIYGVFTLWPLAKFFS